MKESNLTVAAGAATPAPTASVGMRIAVLEDDENQVQMLTRWLEDAAHLCHVFGTGTSLVRSLARESYDLLLLDWQVPEMSGPEVLDWVRRERGNAVPIIFVTAQDSEAAIVQALSAGADDYLVKPLRRLELLARANALWRRSRGASANDSVLDLPPYRIDVRARRIELHGGVVELTDKEFELGVFLFQALGRVLSRGHILECVWGRNPDAATRTVDTHISRLRARLQLGPQNGLRLTAVYSYGYRLEKIGD